MLKGRKRLAGLAALAFVAIPSVAFDGLSRPSPGVKLYFSVPLDARNAKEQTLSAGFAIQGRRDYQTIRIDSGMINYFMVQRQQQQDQQARQQASKPCPVVLQC